MGSKGSAFLQHVLCWRVCTGEESAGIFQKCFPGCPLHTEMLVKGLASKWVLDLRGLEGVSEATGIRIQKFMVVSNSL